MRQRRRFGHVPNLHRILIYVRCETYEKLTRVVFHGADGVRARSLGAHRAALTRIEAVLQQAERLPAGLVLLDLTRRIDCVHLVRTLRARRWTVVAVSEGGDEERNAAAIAAGAAATPEFRRITDRQRHAFECLPWSWARRTFWSVRNVNVNGDSL